MILSVGKSSDSTHRLNYEGRFCKWGVSHALTGGASRRYSFLKTSERLRRTFQRLLRTLETHPCIRKLHYPFSQLLTLGEHGGGDANRAPPARREIYGKTKDFSRLAMPNEPC